MTYLNEAPHNIATKFFGTEPSNLPLLFNALMNAALMFLARYGQSRNAKTRAALKAVLTLLYILHGGSAEERREFIKALLASHTDRLDQLYANYLLWRQRKCWMWGGGCRAPQLSFFDGLILGGDTVPSFEALIPD